MTLSKRTIETPLVFAGRNYPSIASLYRAWEGDKPSEKTFGIKLQRWLKQNPQADPSDEVIRHMFHTRAGTHGLTYLGITYTGPKDLYRSFQGEKISFGGFWQRLKEYRLANPNSEPDDQTLSALLAPDHVIFRGVCYPSLAQLYKAIPGHKIVHHRFVDNVRKWQRANPSVPISDEVVEQCVRFMGGVHKSTFRDQAFPNLKALFDAQPQPKCLWGTFQNRVRKLQALRVLTDDDFALLLQPKAKVRFFKGILYRWTHLPTGKTYIGISSQPLKERIRLHHRQAKGGTYSNPLSLQAALARDGLSAFKVEVLAEFDDEDSMKAAEERAVREHDCLAPKGFNLSISVQ